MMGRRSVALLCVLLAHALLIFSLLRQYRGDERSRSAAGFVSEPITIFFPPEPTGPVTPPTRSRAPVSPTSRQPPPVAAGESTAIVTAPAQPDARVDWPLEGKKAAERVLAQEAEAERMAKMFAGPGGTWASLTKRQRSKLNKFKWKKGVVPEYDANGNLIYPIGEGCVIVSGFIACKLGKTKARGDMFDNMREYFDEQRLPETDEGNGTEPEALRPPY
jgi:hypothetical protein